MNMDAFSAFVRPFIAIGGFIAWTGLVLYAAVFHDAPEWIVALTADWKSMVTGAVFFYLGARASPGPKPPDGA